MVYKVTSVPSATTFTYAQNSGNRRFCWWNNLNSYKAYHIVKDAPIPASATLKVVAGQKVVLNSNDKVIAYASVDTCDIVAGILQEVT